MTYYTRAMKDLSTAIYVAARNANTAAVAAGNEDGCYCDTCGDEA